MSDKDKYVKEVKPFGNSGHIILPVGWVGEMVLIQKKDDDEGEVKK